MLTRLNLFANVRVRLISATLLGLIGLVAVACGGSDKSVLAPGDTNTWDVARADELSHAALIQASDLPGSGWDVTEDDFSDVEYPSTAQCDKMDAFRTEARQGLAGRANRSFSRTPAGASAPLQVNLEVQVHQSAKNVAALMERQRGMLADGTLTSCLEAYLKDVFQADITDLTIDTRAQLLGTAPAGAIAYGFDLTLGSDTLHAEYYAWVQSNAVIETNISGIKGQVDAKLINTVLQKVESSTKLAAAGKAPAAATEAPKSPTAKATAKVPTATPAAAVKAGRLADLKSYRYQVRIEASGTGGPVEDLAQSMAGIPGVPKSGPYVMTVAGAFVRPDKASWVISMGDFEISQVVIGEDEWTAYQGEVEGPYETSNNTATDLSMAEAVLDDEFYGSVVSALRCSGKEAQNGAMTQKCTADQEALARVDSLGTFFGDAELGTVKSYDVSVWLTESGRYPVKVSMNLVGADPSGRTYGVKIDLNVMDTNTNIDIQPPVATP